MTFENGANAPEVVTYKDIVVRGRNMVRLLARAGIGRGDIFAFLMKNQPAFIYALYAAAAMGAVMVPIDPRCKGGRLAYILKDSRAKGILVSHELLCDLMPVLEMWPKTKVIGVAYENDMTGSEDPRFPSLNEALDQGESGLFHIWNKDSDIPLQVLYTSGTTGAPKGVMLRAAHLMPYADLARFVWQYGPDDRLYTGLPLAHGNAQAITLIPSLFLTVPCVISATFTQSRIWDICRAYECTSLSLLGCMMEGIFREPPRADDAYNPVRLMVCAGTPEAIWEAFEQRFHVMIHEWYGTLEGGFAHKPPGMGPLGSFGKTLEGLMEMKVVDLAGRECPPGVTGEIIFRTVIQDVEVEYMGKSNASKEKVRDGWLRTGDMGHRDEDGWFFFDFRVRHGEKSGCCV